MLRIRSLLTCSFIALLSIQSSLTCATNVCQDNDDTLVTNHTTNPYINSNAVSQNHIMNADVSENQYCLTPLNLPGHYLEYIVPFLDRYTKLHQVNKYLFSCIIGYPSNRILDTGFEQISGERNCALMLFNGKKIDFSKTLSSTVPSYFLSNFVTFAIDLPSENWIHLSKTRIENLTFCYNNPDSKAIVDVFRTPSSVSKLIITNIDFEKLDEENLNHFIKSLDLKPISIHTNEFEDGGDSAVSKALLKALGPFEILIIRTALKYNESHAIVNYLPKNKDITIFTRMKY